MDYFEIARSVALRLTDDDNNWRGYDTAEEVIAQVLIHQTDLLRQEVIALKHSVVETVGGTVEGHPTSDVNYLQRLRHLVRCEIALQDALSCFDRDHSSITDERVDAWRAAAKAP